MHERDDEGDWRESRRLVWANDKQLFDAVDKILKKLDEHDDDDRIRFEALNTALTALTTKAGFLGFIGGALASLISGWLLWEITKP